MRFSLSLALIATACVFSSAQTAGQAQQFKEIKGVQEFSGRLIVRPLQADKLAERGLTSRQIDQMRFEADLLARRTALRYIPETDEYIIEVPEGSTEQMTADWLMRTGVFQYVEPDYTVYPTATPNDAQYGSQWGLPKIEAPTAWNHFVGIGSITIAITDTGVRTDHQDLAARLVSGANSATGTAIPQTSGGAVEDINGHGTHCAGIAAAIGNNSVGVSGVNWNAKIMPVRVTNSSGGGSSISALTAGARWAADNGARVVSTSYSGVENAAVQTTGQYIKYTRNGIYLWAAGNDNASRNTDHVDVTVVGASTTTDTKASFSAYGPGLDVFAPGVTIRSTYNSSSTSYADLSGTSMACPMAAGLAGLIMGTNPSLTGAQVENILYTTCTDLTTAPGGVGNDNYWGWGRINARQALNMSYNTYPFLASSFSMISGSALSGNVASLSASDDNKLAMRQPVLGSGRVSPITVEASLNSTNKSIGRLDLIVEGAATQSNVRQRLQMFDYVANSWVTVDLRAASLTDSTVTATPANPNRFRNSSTGDVKVRVTYEPLVQGLGLRAYQASIDRLVVLTAP